MDQLKHNIGLIFLIASGPQRTAGAAVCKNSCWPEKKTAAKILCRQRGSFDKCIQASDSGNFTLGSQELKQMQGLLRRSRSGGLLLFSQFGGVALNVQLQNN